MRGLVLSLVLVLSILPTFGQEVMHELPLLKTATKVSYNIQKFTGFNFIVEHLSEGFIKSYLFFRTKSIKSNVDLNIYSGTDLLSKKAKSLSISLENSRIKNIPLKHVELFVNGPIYIKKNKFLLPIEIKSKIKIDLNKINDVIVNLPKWEKYSKTVNIPLPPFGKIKVEITELNVSLKNNGLINVIAKARSLEYPDSEPLDLRFTGKLYIKDKKLLIQDIKSEIVDIFTKDSELGRAFNKFLEDLINPVLNFRKYEKKGLTIENVEIIYDKNDLILLINAKKLQHKIK